MANDPVNPAGPTVDPSASPAAISPEAATKLKEYEQAVRSAAVAQGDFGTTINRVKGFMGELTAKLGEAGREMERAGQLSEAGAAQFQLIATGAINVRKSFEGFDGIKGLSTFSGQLASIRESLLSGRTATSEVVSSLKKGLEGMGVSQSAIAQAGKAGVDGLMKFAEQQLASADNSLKLSAAYVHQMAATGNLSKVYEQAGDDLGNINVVMDKQAKMIANVGAATNKLPKDVEDAFGAFMKIPGALNSVVDVAGVAGGKLSGLTAIMKLADGTGRTYEEVNMDVGKAITGFSGTVDDAGKNMGKAMEYTERFSQLSRNLHISINDVRGGLGAATDALMKYTSANEGALKMGMGVQNIMNEYAGGLIKAGLTGKEATDMITKMTTSFGSLTTAQRAFLSAQTGGPGGLMGAGQIEKMILGGDIEGVKKKVMEVMKKQVGKVITLDEASKSEAGMQKYEYQRQILQKGPLGGVATTDKEVKALTDMLSGKTKGTEPLSALKGEGKGLSDAINKGSKWEEKSTGFLGQIVQSTNATALALGATNLTLTQNAMGSVSTGDMTRESTDEETKKIRQRNKEYMERGMERSGRNAADINNESGLSSDKTRENKKDALKEVIGTAANAPGDIARAVSTEGKLAATALKGAPKPIDQRAAVQNEIDSRRTAEAARQKATAGQAMRPAQGLVSRGAMPSLDISNFGKTTSPATMVAGARRAPTAPKGAPGAGAVPMVSVEESGSSNKFNVKVKVEVNDKEVGAHRTAQSPGSGDSP